MTYPIALSDIEKDFSLFIPVAEQLQLVYTQLKSKNPHTPFPYWAHIWPSAIALTNFLKSEPHWIEGKQVLELGAGIGLPSFSIAQKAGHLLISDHDLDAIDLLEKNIRHLNLHNAEAICIDWNHFPLQLSPEILLLSDINYAPDQFPALLNLINTFIRQGSTIILSTPQRITVSPFINALEPYIKRSVYESVLHGQQTVNVCLLILSA